MAKKGKTGTAPLLRRAQDMRWCYLVLALLTCTLAGCATPVGDPAPRVPEDQLLIFHNGTVVTLDPEQADAQAIALRGSKILAIGSNEEILALRSDNARVIDLQGRAVLPGFVDAHTHALNDAAGLNMSLDEAQMLLLSNGITTVGDLYVEGSFLQEMQAFDRTEQLRLRTSLYMVFNGPCGERKGNWYTAYPVTRVPGEMLRIGGIKIFTDGGSCGKPALSFELEPGNGMGDLWLTQDELDTAVAQAQAAGYQVAIHAIGDRAVEQAQTAIRSALDGQPNTFRHRMEHVSVIRPEQIARFGEIGIIPVINGQYNACQPFASDIPEPYHDWEWPWRALLDENPGLPIAWHADYPFLHVNPIVHLYGFVTRKDQQLGRYDCLPNIWLRDDLLSVKEALHAMTIDAAYALFRDEEVGSLAPGKFADVIVLSTNPLDVEADDIKNLKVELTIVGGRIEYCAPRARSSLCPGFENRIPRGIPDPRWPPPVRWGLFLPLALGALLFATITLTTHGPNLIRWGGVGAIVGGLLWAGLWFAAFASSRGGSIDEFQWALVYALPFLLVGLASLQSAQAKRAGLLGWLTFGVTGLGMICLTLVLLLTLWVAPDSELSSGWADSLWLIFLGSALATVAGSAFVGLAAWRAGSIPAWGAVLMFLPLAVGLVLMFAGLFELATFGLVLFGAAWVAIGILLWRSRGVAIRGKQPERWAQGSVTDSGD